VIKKHFWEDWQIELLKEKYDGRTETIDMLEKKLYKFPRWQIRRKAAELGLVRSKEPRWTREEEEWLEKHLPRKSIKKIAKQLGRTTTAVKLKAKGLDIRKTRMDGNYSGLEAAMILGCDDHKIIRAIRKGLLKARRRNTERTSAQGGDIWLIRPFDLRNYVIASPGEIDIRRVDKISFIDLLANGDIL